MRTTLAILLAGFLGWLMPAAMSASPAVAQGVDCNLQVYVNTAACIMHMRQAHPPIQSNAELLCMPIHVNGKRKVTFVVKDSAGNLHPDNFDNPLHTSEKTDGAEMCVGRHFWQWAHARGGSVEYCIDVETDPQTGQVIYASKYTYIFYAQHPRTGVDQIAPRLGYGQHVSPAQFAVGLRVR
ncbi:MAG: hypothetical protein WCK46_00460 [Candidatus Adlerbacteria bacterium]